MAIERIASPDWMPRKVPRLPSPRLSSMCTSPVAIGLIGGQPYPSIPSPTMPSSASRLDERPRDLGPFPVVVDDGKDLLVDEVAGPAPVVRLVGRQLVGDAEEVGSTGASNIVVHGGPQRSKT